jgi:3-oxoacyl-[acyl-carrier-protein] synthase-1
MIVIEAAMELFIKEQVKLLFHSPEEMTGCYRSLQVDYPKFFKMDNLSKLGFLASEMLLKPFPVSPQERIEVREDVAIICFNRSSSLETDRQYQASIQNNDDYFPSPSLFVYTLPNIVAGEIAIRNKFCGETSFYICETFDAETIYRTVHNSFSDRTTHFALCAWIESIEEKLEVIMFLITKEKTHIEFSGQIINALNK